jgi:tetraacyldisaccharide 4'-kinase
VISVGNLRVGGSGKTPAVACLARLLIEMGERPSILSRGYGRRCAADGVVVVSDGVRVTADLDRSGDEPLMLARSVPGAAVLVAVDRHLAGRLAELRLGATVHLLDDGFQHLPLARDIDLVIVSADDVRDGRTLPTGRLREPIETARYADALIVPDATEDGARAIGDQVGVGVVFIMARHTGPLRPVAAAESVPLGAGVSAYAVAGIARPERFFDDVAASGVSVVGTRAFPDHRRYTARDVGQIVAAARAAGAGVVVTTEKDLMRLLPFTPASLPFAWLPLTVSIEPATGFCDWIRERLTRASAGGNPAVAAGRGSAE